MNTLNFTFTIKRNFPKILITICFLELSKEFLGIKKRIRISHGKRVIDVRVIEVLL